MAKSKTCPKIKTEDDKSQAASLTSLLDGVVGFSKKHQADLFFEMKVPGKRLRVEIKDSDGFDKI